MQWKLRVMKQPFLIFGDSRISWSATIYRLRDEGIREPDISLEAIGHQQAGYEPYFNPGKTTQRNYYIASSLQENEEDEAAARAHIYSPGERPYVDTLIQYLLTNARTEEIINYNLTNSDVIAVWME